jgi:hypothetical protein
MAIESVEDREIARIAYDDAAEMRLRTAAIGKPGAALGDIKIGTVGGIYGVATTHEVVGVRRRHHFRLQGLGVERHHGGAVEAVEEGAATVRAHRDLVTGDREQGAA